ncbi:MAG: SLC13 family permease [Candidatus Heimdallarchaeaceae archaeon]
MAVLEIIGVVLIVITVVGTVIALMFEGVDATKVTVTGAVITMIIFFFFTDWHSMLQENMNVEHVPEHFLEAIAGMVNVEAIVIIFSVSIIVALTKEAGFFDFISLSIVKLTKGDPKKLILALGALTFFVSMFFDNLSAIILLGSLTVIICKELELNPIPFVLFVGINTIIGGLPTPVSSLPNIIFYSLYQGGDMSFIKFTALMFPISIIFFFLASGYFFLVFKKEIFIEVSEDNKKRIARINPWSGIDDRSNVWKSTALLALLFAGFLSSSFIGLGVATIALIVAVIGIFLFKTTLKKFIEHGVEWEMIVFFIALFVLMGILAGSGSLQPISNIFIKIFDLDISPVTAQILVAIIIGVIGLPITGFLNGSSSALIFSYIFTTLVSSVAVEIGKGTWIAFVLGGNIGGSLTPLGSITILMTLEILNREGYAMSFVDYIKKTLPLTLTFGIVSIGYAIILILLGA